MVYATRYAKEYHSSLDCAGIAEGHALAELQGNQIHPAERMSRWQAKSKGFRRTICVPQ
jgi:hypothetical protein